MVVEILKWFFTAVFLVNAVISFLIPLELFSFSKEIPEEKESEICRVGLFSLFFAFTFGINSVVLFVGGFKALGFTLLFTSVSGLLLYLTLYHTGENLKCGFFKKN